MADATERGIDGRRRDWARRAALHYLERYSASEASVVRVLRRKLRRRAAADPDGWTLDREDAERLIAGAVSACRDMGLLDDAAFAETRVAGGRRRGQSARRLMASMVAKGVDRDTAEAAVAADPTDERRAALVFARRRRLGPFSASAGDPDRRAKDMAALCRQGFGYAVARAVVALDRETAEAEMSDPDA